MAAGNRRKVREWLERYIPAEILGTLVASIAAWSAFSRTHSYLIAAGSGWAGEGVGFYGYFIVAELVRSSQKTRDATLFHHIIQAITQASTNLLVEFAPAELLDTFIFRPFLLYLLPQHIHPYALGFLVGKFSSDLIFYAAAIVGYEARKRWIRT